MPFVMASCASILSSGWKKRYSRPNVPRISIGWIWQQHGVIRPNKISCAVNPQQKCVYFVALTSRRYMLVSMKGCSQHPQTWKMLAHMSVRERTRVFVSQTILTPKHSMRQHIGTFHSFKIRSSFNSGKLHGHSDWRGWVVTFSTGLAL